MSIDNAMIYTMMASAPDGFGHEESYDPFAPSKDVPASSWENKSSNMNPDANVFVGDRRAKAYVLHEEDDKHDDVKLATHPDDPAPKYNAVHEEDEETMNEQPPFEEEHRVVSMIRERSPRFSSVDLDTELKDFTNEEYFEMKKNVDRLADLAGNLRAKGKDFVSKARSLADVSFQAAKELKTFYDENRSEFRDLSRVHLQATGQIRYDTVRHIEELYCENIEKPINFWLEEYNRLAWKAEQRSAAQKRMEHYVYKVQRLHASEEKMKAKGKPIPVTGADRIKRNDHKLQVSENEFKSLNSGLCMELDSVWRHRLILTDPAFKALAELELVFFDKANGNHLAICNAMRQIDHQSTQDELQPGHHPNNYQSNNIADALKFDYTPDDEQVVPVKVSWWKRSFTRKNI